MSKDARVADSGESTQPDGVRRGWVLVAIQGALFAGVVIAAFVPPVGPELWTSTPVALAVVVAGAVGVVFAARHLGSALTPHPVSNGTGLAVRGVYKQVRHPMYSSLVLICLGVVLAVGTLAIYAVVAGLAVLFEVKTRMEEQYLMTAYDGYAEYAARTGKFVPGVGRRRVRS